MKKLFFFLVTILLPMSVFAYNVKIDGIYYVLNKTDKTAWVTNAGANSDENIYIGDIIIPSEIIYENESYIVTTIDGCAFAGCTSLTSVTIPNSVTTIYDDAFNDCLELTSINIPNSVTYIGWGAFSNTGWYNNQPEGILYLGNLLLGYKGVKPTGELFIKEGTVGIMTGAFFDCDGLTSITLPNSIISICEDAFAGCSALTSITIPNGVKFIGPGAFSNCI